MVVQTTILAACYDGGVVLAADSRTSTGTYVANRASDKITCLTENVYICRSGSAADTQFVARLVQYYLEQHSLELQEQVQVKTAANLVMQVAYRNKDKLQAGMIVAGWDRHAGGSVWAVPLGGTLLQVPFTIGGSGSAYITGWCDKNWRSGMTKEECKMFAMRAVSHAMARDGSSGGCIRLVTIDAHGATADFVPGHQVPLYQDEVLP